MTDNKFTEIRNRFETKNELTDILLDTIYQLAEYPKDNKYQLKYYKSILKKMLEMELVRGSLFVKDIKQMYSFDYPTKYETSVGGFKQFEVVLETTKRKYELGVVLDIYPEIGKGNKVDLTQEVRVDTNGNIVDEHLKKASLNDVMKYLNFRKQGDLNLLKGILYTSLKKKYQ